jgi:hypothetical protein
MEKSRGQVMINSACTNREARYLSHRVCSVVRAEEAGYRTPSTMALKPSKIPINHQNLSHKGIKLI